MSPVITTDLEHQAEYLAWVDGREFDGLFTDPGTGKTRMILRRAEQLHDKGKIDALLVIAPNGVKTSWVAWPHMLLEEGDMDEVTKHLGDDRALKGVWINGATGLNKKAWAEFESAINKRTDKLIVIAVNYEALLSENVLTFLMAFMKKYRTLLAADEGTRLGTPGAQRTKRSIKLGKLSSYRTDATGTPILKAPTKIFSQAKFLDKGTGKALGYTSFYAFRNRHCIMGGFQGRQILSYQNLDELGDKIASWSFRRKLEDVVKMPPRAWHPRYVYMQPEQALAYKTMREDFFAMAQDTQITATIVLAQMTRLQQILGGFLSKDGVELPLVPDEKNPKVQEAWGIINEADDQVLVWFRFRAELEAMARWLAKKQVSFMEFHGGHSTAEKVAIRKGFKRGEAQVLLGMSSAGGIGIDEFKVARDAIFFSNDFDTERREQTEKRNWRYGVTDATRYWDILVPNTVDMKIVKVMRGDAKLSATIMREELREWL